MVGKSAVQSSTPCLCRPKCWSILTHIKSTSQIRLLQEVVEGTLMKQYRTIKEQLARWRDRKSQRMEEIEALQVTICLLLNAT